MADVLISDELKALRAIYYYDPETGILIRRSTGEVMGWPDCGYLRCYIQGVKVLLHRVIWFYIHGTRADRVKHRNDHNMDNRLCNLADATRGQTLANYKAHPRRGIEKHGRKYRARLYVDDSRLELGSFETEYAARTAYDRAAKFYFGDFYRSTLIERRY